MAEEKKGDKKFGDKKPAGGGGFDSTELLVIGILLIIVGGAIVERLYNFVITGNASFYGVSLSGVKTSFQNGLPTIKAVAYTLSLIFAFGTVIFSQLRNKVLATERKKLGLDYKPMEGAPPLEAKNPVANKWRQVSIHVESANPSDWRLAIIECDILLSELLDTLRLPGDTMGDKMKAVEKSDFTTIDMAWEAHKIRNQIAHAGSEFLLNQREARRVISLYTEVFKEFHLV